MKVIATPAYRNWFILGLCVQLVAAWFSVGYHHPDEHFQVLEFCNYKLGYSPASELPWEFAAQCRPAMQPFIAYLVSKALLTVGIYNPFRVAFMLRVIIGLLTWVVTYRLVKLMLPEFRTDGGRRAFVFCSFFLWFVPYVGVRFSAENIAGILFFLSLSYLLPIKDYSPDRRTFVLLGSGLLFGVSLFLRVQMAFAFLAFGLWVLMYGRWEFRYWALICLGGVSAIGMCVCIDHWFYGTWVLTPYNYFHVNMVENKAAKYGVYPFWFYITRFLEIGVLPISLTLLLLFFKGIWEKKLHVFTWICISFIVGHSLIGHKEMRFLFPVMPAFIFLACCGWEAIALQYPAKKIYRWGIPSLLTVNTVVLLFKIFTAAHETIKYHEAIYSICKNKNSTLIVADNSPYHVSELEINFYKPKDLDIQVIKTKEEIPQILAHTSGRQMLFLSPMFVPDAMIEGYKTEKAYCMIPDWMSYVNFTDWESRSYIWRVYRFDASYGSGKM